MSLIKYAAQRARVWLTDTALPLWGGAGVDETGAFYERLNFDGRPDLLSNRRMRVQARQLYCFSEAAVRGWWEPAQGVAERGFEAMVRDCWMPDGKPGLLHMLTPDRRPLDFKRDTYDHAFGLFSLAWYYKATAQPEALTMAHLILDMLEADLADPAHGGFLESRPSTLPRRSDPHMHLLEACLEWTEVTGDKRFLQIASRMVALFKARFFDRDTGTLREFFGADLTPAEGQPGQAVYPGHHFEWTWLLAWAQTLGAGEAESEAIALYDYGRRYGLNNVGLTIDECDRHGQQIRRSGRAWPQTELIKAHITKARGGSQEAEDAVARVTMAFLDNYLETEVGGLWIDQFDEDGREVSDAVPASTFYHIVVAFRELLLFVEQTRYTI